MIDYKSIANELGITQHQVQKTINLLNDGATIPFISRYRKEQTGELDEVVIASIKNLKTINLINNINNKKNSNAIIKIRNE